MLKTANAHYNQTYDYDKTAELLKKEGFSDADVESTMVALQHYHKAKERKAGLWLTAIGSFLLIFGFLLSIILHYMQMPIDIALFGPTTIGVTLLIWGMAKLF